MAWQERALKVVDLIPELDYVSRFYSRMLKQLRLYPATRDEHGKLKEIESGEPVDVLNRIRDAGGTQSGILGRYGTLMFITGEGNLFGHDLDTDDESWLFVWNDELRVERGADGIKQIIWTPASTSNPREYGPDEAVVYKFWTPHPRRSGEATSPMRAIVEGDIAEELIALTKSVRSTATTRTTQGILVIPQEISPPPAEPIGDEDPEESPWITHIAEHMEAQVEQAGSAAAAAPYLMEVPYDYADRIRIVQLHDPQHDYLEGTLRKEAIERIARGVDFPPEALLGIGGTNHWAALQILMDMWRSHGAPIAQTFCDDLTSSYLRPALKEMGYTDWRNVVVAYDASAVTAKPDRADDAKTAIEQFAIGPKGLRTLLNISDDLAPTDEEIELMLEARGKSRTPEPEPAAASVDMEPPPPGPEGDSGRRSRVTASAGQNGNGHTREVGVIELALMRCRELAGIRIRQKAGRRLPELDLDAIPFADVAAFVGQEALKEVGCANAYALVLGGADNLRSLLRVWGYPKEQADLFCEVVEVQAARTLFELEFPSMDERFAALAEQLEFAA